ncbi:unnamed protein product [Lactuca virosa]|uniref:Secreted protein n=1 Tax=Lactuca virosa TaxID=75947 RepID=A0AAU9N5A0_9ASTR|nr:unnamed protein product [Lactuca virosa]
MRFSSTAPLVVPILTRLVPTKSEETQASKTTAIKFLHSRLRCGYSGKLKSLEGTTFESPVVTIIFMFLRRLGI